jgi:VanZ family protein
VIFSASGDKKSFQHSSRIIGPLLHWLFPHISDHATDTIVFFARKCAHLTEYAILALFFWRGLRKPVRNDPRPWSWMEAKNAVLLVALYAATDEFHQLFVPSRDAQVHDVVIDTIGGAVGIIALWLIGKLLGWWKPSATADKT